MILNSEQLIQILNGWGFFAIFGSLIISIIVAILGILPSIFITAANIVLFGTFYGFIISWLGEIFGAYVSFYLYRYGFKKISYKHFNKNRLLKTLINSRGQKVGWLIFQARLLPFIPSGVITFIASLSEVSIGIFLIATAIGKAPSILIEVLVSYNVINFNKNWIHLIFTIISLVILYIIFRKNNKVEIVKD